MDRIIIKNSNYLVVHAPPLYIQEKVHPKVLIEDLLKHPSPSGRGAGGEGEQIDLFADFNGLPDDNAKTEFYQHDAHWANRMILGDRLQVMASLAEREGLRGRYSAFILIRLTASNSTPISSGLQTLVILFSTLPVAPALPPMSPNNEAADGSH